ncbi:hypothetical protein [Saccharomonospora saliphila]|nr:hypothetical protein [Saccharomonospora saliphila]
MHHHPDAAQPEVPDTADSGTVAGMTGAAGGVTVLDEDDDLEPTIVRGRE